MKQQQLEKRKRIMARSITLGHCVCDPRKPCPCPLFKEKNICECAGEHLPTPVGEIKLTEFVRAAGCASKIGKKDLREILSGLPEVDDPRVVIGRSAGDDAGVIMLDEKTATVLTVDVFAPCVDDPYEFGQIAAANSISDIYAMGATPQSSLSIIGFPIHTLPGEVMHEILRGGVDKMAEAGIGVIGGHSINDDEIKCGFAVIGTAPAGTFRQNRGACVGDAIILSKPLGNGIVSFGKMIGKASAEEMRPCIEAMKTLNKSAAELMVKHKATAATDITGFSLLGHMAEIVRNSNIEVQINMDSVPLFAPVMDLAKLDAFPGAMERNRESVPETMLDFGDTPTAAANVLFSPETSGGILAFIPQEQAENYLYELKESGAADAAIIGEVTANKDDGLIRVRCRKPESWQANDNASKVVTQSISTPSTQQQPDTQDAGACCCNSVLDSSEQTCCSSEPTASAKADNASGFLAPPAATAEFSAYMKSVNSVGALDEMTTKLISLALSVSHKCEPCVKINTEACRKAGASTEQISQAVALGISFGGATVNMFYNDMLRKG